MAQRTVVHLIDDIDGSDAAETITFALDGVQWEIDLNAEHADELRDAFARWTGSARRAGSAGRGRKTSSSRGKSGRNLAEIRAWATENGYTVSDRGRVAAEILEAYDAAH